MDNLFLFENCDDFVADFCDVLLHLESAVAEIELYQDISLHDMIFETVESKDNSAENSTAQTSILGHIKKAIEGLIKIIREASKTVLGSVSNFITFGKGKDLVAKYKEAVKKDPSLKEKKIEVPDLEKMDKAFDKAIAVAEAADKANELKQKENEILKEIKDFGIGITTAVSLDTAVNLMERNKNVAGYINKKLKDEESFLTKLLSKCDKADVKRFKKDAKNLSKDTFLHRFKVGIFRKRAKNYQSGLSGLINAIAVALPFTKAHTDKKRQADAMVYTGKMMQNPTVSKAFGKLSAHGLEAAGKVKRKEAETRETINEYKQKYDDFKAKREQKKRDKEKKKEGNENE